MCQRPKRRHCWKCSSRHSKPIGFKCTRAISVSIMDSGLNALLFGSTTSTSASWCRRPVCKMPPSLGVRMQPQQRPWIPMAWCPGVLRTLLTTTTTTTTFIGNRTMTVLCSSMSTRLSAPCPVTQPSAAMPTSCALLVKSSHLSAPLVPLAAGLPAQGIMTTNLAATLQSLTSIMASMNARMLVLESAATANQCQSGPGLGTSHVELPFLPYSDSMQHLPLGVTPALSTAINLVPGPTNANAPASAPAAIPAGHQIIAKRMRQELIDIHLAPDSSNTSSSDSDVMAPRRKNVHHTGTSLDAAGPRMTSWYGECPGPTKASTKFRHAKPLGITRSPF